MWTKIFRKHHNIFMFKEPAWNDQRFGTWWNPWVVNMYHKDSKIFIRVTYLFTNLIVLTSSVTFHIERVGQRQLHRGWTNLTFVIIKILMDAHQCRGRGGAGAGCLCGFALNNQLWLLSIRVWHQSHGACKSVRDSTRPSSHQLCLGWKLMFGC